MLFKKIKKGLALSMAFSMLFSNNSFATPINIDNSTESIITDTLNKTEGTDHFSDEHNNNWNNGNITEKVKVTVDITSNFEIIIPKEIVLSGETKSAKYNVKATGDIAGDQVLEIKPDTEFTMSDGTPKNDVMATVIQEDFYYFYTDLLGEGTSYEGEITAPLTAGEWSGRFNFNIAYLENLFVDINPTITYTTTSSSTPQTKTFTSYEELKNFTTENTTLKEVIVYNREQQLPNEDQTSPSLPEGSEIAEKPTSFSSYFKGCTNLTKLDLRNFAIEDTLDVAEMINSCDNLLDENIIGLNVPKATNVECIREHIMESTETEALTKYKCKYCSYSDEYKTYSCSNDITEITLEPGTYKLEVWGGQGGSGGKGGYSYGNITLEETTTLYVCVGGAGEYKGRGNYSLKGGYNGGNDLTTVYSKEWIEYYRDYYTDITTYGTGGGATHIALSTGLLSEFYNKQEDLLLVAGGGGGYYYYYTYRASNNNNTQSVSSPQYGGGGNNKGGDAIRSGKNVTWEHVFTGSSTNYGGGLEPTEDTFGKAVGTGGGGYEGGRGHGAGGSGYLSSILTESGGISGTRSGNGYAKITRIS